MVKCLNVPHDIGWIPLTQPFAKTIDLKIWGITSQDIYQDETFYLAEILWVQGIMFLGSTKFLKSKILRGQDLEQSSKKKDKMKTYNAEIFLAKITTCLWPNFGWKPWACAPRFSAQCTRRGSILYGYMMLYSKLCGLRKGKKHP